MSHFLGRNGGLGNANFVARACLDMASGRQVADHAFVLSYMGSDGGSRFTDVVGSLFLIRTLPTVMLKIPVLSVVCDIENRRQGVATNGAGTHTKTPLYFQAGERTTPSSSRINPPPSYPTQYNKPRRVGHLRKKRCANLLDRVLFS